MRMIVAVKAESLRVALQGYPARLLERLVKFFDRESLELTAYVKEDKLSGQVLNVRTGTLRRSIHRDLRTTANEVVATVGTNVEYARIHEYGFHGEQSVHEHLRMMKQAFGRPVRNPRPIRVRAHVRRVDLPERSFLRSALADLEARITEGAGEAAREALEL